MTTLDRIKQLRDERGWTNYRLAKESGISEGAINNLFRLNNQPTIPTLESLCGGFKISLAQFFANDNEAVPLNNDQKEILKLWNTLHPKQKKALLDFLKTL